MSGYVYILENDSARNYIGSCVNPARRLHEHNGEHVTATAGRGPWRRTALLEFETPTLARQAEAWLKKLHSPKYARLIIAGTFRWPEKFGAVRILEPASDKPSW